MATMHLVHLEEESAKRDEEVEIKDPDSINRYYGRVHGVPGTGCEGCPSGGEVLLPLLQSLSTLSLTAH